MFERDPKTALMGEEILPFEMGYLPEFFEKKAEAELNDTPDNRQKAIRVLKELIEHDKHCSGIILDDDFLLQYLRCRKFNPKRAFSQITAFVQLRKNNKSIFKEFYFENSAVCTRSKIVSFLPYRCQDGCAIILVKLDNWIPEEFPVEEVKRTVIIFLLQSLRDPMTQVNGFKVIFDVESNPIRHLRHCTPSNLYLMYYGSQECSPGRFKAIHIINMSLTAKTALAILKFFMSSKLKKRIHFHDTPQGLLDYFPPSVLPVEYGGELKYYDTTDWLQDVMSPEKIATLSGGLGLTT